MKKLLMIAAMAMFATVACDKKDEPGPTPGAPDVTMTAPTEVAIGKTINITATLSKAAEGDVTIKAVSADPTVLTVADITIAKGSLSGTAVVTGVKEGTAKVSFTSTTATVKTAELTIAVKDGGTPPPPPTEYGFPEFEWGTYSAVSKIVIGTTTITSSAADSPDGENKMLAGNDDFGIGFVNDDKTATIVPLTDGIAYTISYSKFTANEAATEMYVVLYIDWNGNGKFTDAGEEIKLEKGVFANADKTITGTITIPANAVASSRARVMCFYSSGNSIEGGEGYAESGNLIDFTYSK